jgi:hypothetical protein
LLSGFRFHVEKSSDIETLNTETRAPSFQHPAKQQNQTAENNGFDERFTLRSRSCPCGAGYFAGAFVTFVEQKQKNLPTQIGWDIFHPNVDARSVGRLMEFFKVPSLRVSAYHDLTRRPLVSGRTNLQATIG